MKRVSPFLLLLALATGTTVARDVRAQTAPAAQQLQNPAALPPRQAIFAWDKELLRASFSFRDVADDVVKKKLSSGLHTLVAVRAYLFEEGRNEPVALAARTCSVVYDLWEDVYSVTVTDASGERKLTVINEDGVVRRCMEAQDFPIVDRALLKKGKAYFLGVIVEVNPISDDMLKQLKQWVSRPTGATALTAGDALFGSFVGLFVRQIGTGDRTLVFRTRPPVVP
jgi:hypothetical protein